MWRRIDWLTFTDFSEEAAYSIFLVDDNNIQSSLWESQISRGLLFEVTVEDPEGGGSTFVRNIGKYLPDFAAPHSSRHNSL
jgi:hypothetical protein